VHVKSVLGSKKHTSWFDVLATRSAAARQDRGRLVCVSRQHPLV